MYTIRDSVYLCACHTDIYPIVCCSKIFVEDIQDRALFLLRLTISPGRPRLEKYSCRCSIHSMAISQRIRILLCMLAQLIEDRR